MKRKKTTEPLPPLTARQVSQALGLKYNVAGVLQPTGVLDRTAVQVNGTTMYTTYALPVLALLNDIADAVERGQMDVNEAGRALGALTPAAFREWDAVLAEQQAYPLTYHRAGRSLVFDGMKRAAVALRKIRSAVRSKPAR